MRPNLRLFIGEDEQVGTDLAEPQVAIRFEDFAKIVSDATKWDRTWLADFANDHISVSADLYEVLTAYAQMRPSA